MSGLPNSRRGSPRLQAWGVSPNTEGEGTMDEKAQKGIQHALKYLEELEKAYAEWNAAFDNHDERLLQILSERIDSLRNQAPAELHNLLFALGAVDQPMAR